MKDFSSFFFLKKNSLGSLGTKKRKGMHMMMSSMRSNFCNGNCSTSTLNQSNRPPISQYPSQHSDYNYCTFTSSPAPAPPTQSRPTLEDMILQLELEEEVARRSAKATLGVAHGRTTSRLSSVDNTTSDNILISARDALNHYPRFSLDGKDAMYRSSFRNLESSLPRKSIYGDRGLRDRLMKSYHPAICCFPPTLAGEPVIWCAPGVVAKLMGLEAIPVPVHCKKRTVQNSSNKDKVSYVMKRQNLRRTTERHETQRRSVAAMDNVKPLVSSSKPAYCVLNPVAIDVANTGGWPTRRFL